jgi:hypothetical protein
MAAGKEGEPFDLCEECGSPLEDGVCRNCGAGFSGGASPVGAAPLDRSELSRVLGRGVGARAHGSYSLSMQQEEGMAPLRREVDLLVEQFTASPEAKSSAKQSAERLAVKVMEELGPTKAAIASVAQEFLRQGRSMAEVSSCVGRIHAGMDRVKDLIVEAKPDHEGEEMRVLVDGRDRPFSSYGYGLYAKLRILVFSSDDGKLLEIKGAAVTKKGYDPRRMVRAASWSEFQIRVEERNFELFKILEEARLSGRGEVAGTNQSAMLRKYSISRLRLTERLLREAGLLQRVSGEYVRLFAEAVGDGRGRSPRKLAEEALIEACEEVVPAYLRNSLWQKYHLKASGMRSLVVVSELAAWQG